MRSINSSYLHLQMPHCCSHHIQLTGDYTWVWIPTYNLSDGVCCLMLHQIRSVFWTKPRGICQAPHLHCLMRNHGALHHHSCYLVNTTMIVSIRHSTRHTRMIRTNWLSIMMIFSIFIYSQSWLNSHAFFQAFFNSLVQLLWKIIHMPLIIILLDWTKS